MPTSVATMDGVDRDAAVQRLVALASGRGFALAFDLLGTRAEAEDAVQDALVRAIAGLARLRDPDALDGWFYRVLTNGCLRVLRRRRIVGAFARLVGARGDVGYLPAQLAPDHAKLLALIDQLPAMQKAALVLRQGHDLSVEEIARVLEIGTETVKTHLKRARARLRAELGVDHDG
jgi:RNA polymerase sigma-70 factor, ECF subfamily